MAMIKYSKYLALALLTTSAVAVYGQDENPAPSREDPEALPPSEFVPEGQIVPVAEEGIDDVDTIDIVEGDDFVIPEATPEDELNTQFELFKELMASNVYDEADTVAKRVVELAIDLHGPGSNEFAKALTNLAIVQFQTGEYDAAQQNFESAVEIIEDNEDRLNAQLVNPLKGLGAAQLESGRPDLASRTFRRAVHVTHVNEGPHNMDQIELLESIAETHLRMGDMEAAKEAQDAIYAINVREYELDTPALVPSLLRRAEWQHRAGFIFDERATYRRAIRIIEEHEGKDSINLVEPLIKLGRSYFFLDATGTISMHDSSMSSGEIYFRRGARIAAESPDSNWGVVAQATLALGDYYMYSNNPQRGKQVYKEAWDLLSESEESIVVRREQLEQVIPLKQDKLPMYVGSSGDKGKQEGEDPLLQGSVSITYSVSERGRATDLKLIEAQPPEFENMVNRVQRELRRRIYRPRLVEGEVVSTPDLTLVHKYFFRQSDLDAAVATAEDDET
jgi:tetratricopeptide (TPR) repeat protein